MRLKCYYCKRYEQNRCIFNKHHPKHCLFFKWSGEKNVTVTPGIIFWLPIIISIFALLVPLIREFLYRMI